MATVSWTGSMLNCSTPMLNGMGISRRLLLLRLRESWEIRDAIRKGSQRADRPRRDGVHEFYAPTREIATACAQRSHYPGSCHECSRPLINCQRALFRGVGTPTFSPDWAIAPFMKSTSVRRFARTSCSMLARCLPGALDRKSTRL